MKRQHVAIVTILSLCSACASPPRSEVQVLAADVERTAGREITCGFGDVRLCDVDFDGKAKCTCLDQQSVFGPRRPGSAWFDQ